MAMKFRDDNENEKSSDTPGRDAMEELRSMFDRESSGNPLTNDEIDSRFGQGSAEMVQRVQVRLDELVDSMKRFNQARKSGGDPAPALMDFTRLMSSTMQRYNSMEISSMLATGIAAIAELEGFSGFNSGDTDD